jgi:hypothetical protein
MTRICQIVGLATLLLGCVCAVHPPSLAASAGSKTVNIVASFGGDVLVEKNEVQVLFIGNSFIYYHTCRR